MNDMLETKKFKADLSKNASITINEKQIKVINNIFSISSMGTIEINEENLNKAQNTDKIWTTISNKGLEKQSNIIMKDYKLRTLLIENIVSLATRYNIKGINVNFTNIEDGQNFIRFIIELAPRLREIGISTNIILTDGLNEIDYAGIVDYVIEK